MRCDLEGLLINSLKCQPRGQMQAYYEYCLRELLENLSELKRRSAKGDSTAVAEFFEVYVIDEKESQSCLQEN